MPTQGTSFRASADRVWLSAPTRLPQAVRLLALLSFFGALLLVRRAYRHLGYPEAHPPLWIGLLLATMVSASIVLAARPDRRGRYAAERRWFWPAYLLAFLATRALAIVLLPTQPISDYAAYMSFARNVAAGTALDATHSEFLAWGYPLVLAGWLAVFGTSLLAAQFFTVLLQVATVPLIAYLGWALSGPRGRTVLLWLFLLWPGAWLLTSVPATEHAATMLAAVLMTLALKIATSARGRTKLQLRSPRPWVFSAAAGLTASLLYAVRPAAGVLLPAVLVVVWLCGATVRTRLLATVCLAGCFLIGVFAFNQVARRLVGYAPPSVMCWNLLVGQNEEHKGRWNDDDMRYFWFRGSLAASEQAGWEELRRRAQRPLGRTFWLGWQKLDILWGDNYYATFWASRALRPGTAALLARDAQRWLHSFAQVTHLVMLALAAVGLWRMARGWISPPLVLALMVVLAGSLLHCVFETQNRYQHVFFLGALMLACAAFRADDAGGSGPLGADDLEPSRVV